MIEAATPYLILHGRARDAIALYTRAFGAKTESLERFGDMDAHCPDARKDHVMHAALRIGRALLMVSDGPEIDAPRAGHGVVSVALDFSDEAELRRCFEALAATGQVFQLPFDAPWNAVFAVVQDELGVSWMLNFSKPKT